MKSCRHHGRFLLLAALAIAFAWTGSAQAQQPKLKALYLGDNGHHQPRVRFGELQPVLAQRGITLTYTDQTTDLKAKTLARYDALLLYANIDRIEPAQAKALLDYVAAGGAFVPIHCATFCFRNSPEVVALMGAQFKRHGTGTFRTQIAQPDHPIMQGFGGFESWDETYVHHLHNEKNRTVLAYRVDADGREPWTWIRTHGKGRVFYTAWGHDQRTWNNKGYQNLIERGIRWATGGNPQTAGEYLAELPFPVPQTTPKRKDVKPFEYVEVGPKIPNYTPGKAWGTQAAAKTKMQKPLSPKESLKHVVLPVGFRVELFASEPDLGGKPIAMTWDERGRLWVAETYDYPNELQPPGKGRDRIRICEDTDGDWKADKFTVFAEGLSIPTSIMFHKGGVIVHDGTQTLYLKDTNGDDRADQRRVLFSNWRMGDTHGGVSNFQYGLDNWVWAMQGYNQSQPTVDGEKQSGFRMGFFRFRPDGSELEFIRSTNNNTWGLGISEEGLIFGSTANRNPSVYMPIPNRYYEAVQGWKQSLVLGTIADTHLFNPVDDTIRQVDQHGGYTAAAGHALYTARNYPQEYWNRTAFVNGPTGHLVGTFVLKPEGADFHSTSPYNLFASDDDWSAPIMSEVGPDGNVWVLDWYNYIVQHNPTPKGFTTGKGNAYESDLRDKRHGRILRVVYDDAAHSKPVSLADATPQQLVATLKHDTMIWRKHAQRLLVERADQNVVPALIAAAQDQSVDAIGLNPGVIHALWTLHGLGALDGSNTRATAVARAALKHPSAGVRRNALQVLPPTAGSVTALLEENSLRDPDAQVRLAAFLALADLPPTPAAGKAILAAITAPENADDRWIPDAATTAAAHNSARFLPALAARTQLPPKLVPLAAVVTEHYARSGSGDSIAQLMATLAQANPRVVGSIVAGLARGWPADRKPTLDAQTEKNMEALLAKLSPGSRGLLVKLATDWGSDRFAKHARQIIGDLLAQVDDDELDTRKRVAAARQLSEFRRSDEQAVAMLLERVTPQTPPSVAGGIVQALDLNDSPKAGTLLLERFPELTPGTRKIGISILLSRPEWTKALLAGTDNGTIQLAELSLDQKQALADHPDRDLRRRARQLLKRGGALPNADRQKVLEELLPTTKVKGDALAGKQVFLKECAKCHVHSGEGTRIGPDLTGMAVHPKEELLTHIIDPNRSVEGNFRVYSVSTARGVVIGGLLASESKTAIELFDAEGKRQTILREDIDELRASSNSLMPEGFEKQVTHKDVSDLLEFLTARGRYLPVDLRKAATITSVKGMFISKDADVERLIFPDWSPKTVKGVPFQLIDPQAGEVANVILLHSPMTPLVSKMPKSATVPCNGPARAIHLLSGVSGWGFPYGGKKTVSMIVRLHYTDGKTEDHELVNGEHFADYIRRVDVPKSDLAFMLRGQQIRYLALYPKRPDSISSIEFVKGPDATAPVVMAVTLESP